jgi:hypothetical protein
MLARLRRYYQGIEPLDMTPDQIYELIVLVPELASEERGETNHTARVERAASERRRREELIW